MERQLTFQKTDHGITIIEGWHERKGMACSYLIESDGEVALIDTGTALVSDNILELIDTYYSRENVRYVIPTHVHLDHAGGAGQLMQALPGATLYVHPYGSRHMIDPSKLQAGASAVYGEDNFKKSFGQLIAIPQERVVETEDGMPLDLNGRKLVLLDTPGHARHHLCVWDELSKGIFTGDVFGNAYPELTTEKGRYLTPVTSPVQLDPPAWHSSIDKLLELSPERMYLTHYGVLEQPSMYRETLHKDLDAYVELITTLPVENRYEAVHERIKTYHREKVKEHGCNISNDELDYLIGSDNELCAQGLDFWMQRQEKATS